MPTDKRRVAACKRHFRQFYPDGFADADYVTMERLYKWRAHEEWELMPAAAEADVARTAVRIESRTNLLFSFEKMAIRDAVSTPRGAKTFVHGLRDWLDGVGTEQERFERWVAAVTELPRRQTRVVTWPVLTVFGFLARPQQQIFLKPTVTKRAAERFGFEFRYSSRPEWETYASLLEFASVIRAELADWKPRDMIDIQSFIWVLGSSEYE